jgi:hypothetical protein
MQLVVTAWLLAPRCEWHLDAGSMCPRALAIQRDELLKRRLLRKKGPTRDFTERRRACRAMWRVIWVEMAGCRDGDAQLELLAVDGAKRAAFALARALQPSFAVFP